MAILNPRGAPSAQPERCAQLFEAHSGELLGFFVRRTLDAQASLDLVGETFAEAFAGRRRFRGTTDEEARAWLYGIARNLLSQYWRRGRWLMTHLTSNPLASSAIEM